MTRGRPVAHVNVRHAPDSGTLWSKKKTGAPPSAAGAGGPETGWWWAPHVSEPSDWGEPAPPVVASLQFDGGPRPSDRLSARPSPEFPVPGGRGRPVRKLL